MGLKILVTAVVPEFAVLEYSMAGEERHDPARNNSYTLAEMKMWHGSCRAGAGKSQNIPRLFNYSLDITAPKILDFQK